MTFEKVGSYWTLPIHRKVWMNVTYWFRGLWMFVRVIFNYKESIVENELSLGIAWSLCFSIQEARMGKTLRYTPLTNKEAEGDGEVH